jgi:uncharacterized membrane protein YdfJ with MMPL/SSD domain
LLLLTFRSIVIPIKAIVLNLLSVAAAYDVLVLVFQGGVGKDILGFTYEEGVVAFLPIFLFVILFGLSMDYHVFILSRVREGYDSGMKTEDAVAHGIKVTAGVVTSAAFVMVFVFSIFGTLSILFLKEFGVGLAAAILIDATIVRAVLLPATMKLLGDWNWYLPSWLEWLTEDRLRGKAGVGDAGANSDQVDGARAQLSLLRTRRCTGGRWGVCGASRPRASSGSPLLSDSLRGKRLIFTKRWRPG